MEKIDVQHFKKYYNNNEDATLARVGHVNAVIQEVNTLSEKVDTKITTPQNLIEGGSVVWNGSQFVSQVVTPGGGGLEGTTYVYVAANGTPEENAEELQAAYELAEVKVDYQSEILPLIPNYFYYDNSYLDLPFELYVEFGGGPIETDVVYELLFDGVSYFASFIAGGGWYFVDDNYPIGAGYTTLEILVSTITYNLVTVVVAPGKYSFDTDFLVNKDHINIVSLTGNADVLFTGDGTIDVTVDGIFLKGIDVQDKPFTIATDLDLLRVENCIGSDYSFGGDGEIVSGTFTDCIAGGNSFGGSGNASGTFTDCIAGGGSFGGSGNVSGTASGTFNNCIGGDYSFGRVAASGTFNNCQGGGNSFGNFGIASGTFNNCIGISDSFGSYGTASGTFTDCIGDFKAFGGGGGITGTASGTFTNCRGGGNSFGHSTASGTFTNCRGGGYSFGNNGTASGTFTNCVSGNSSFGGTASGIFTNCTAGNDSFSRYGTASGTFTNCQAGYGSFGNIASGIFTNCQAMNLSFGTRGGVASGTFINCQGDNYSFGGTIVGEPGGVASGTFTNCIGKEYSFGKGGTLSGKLYYCRLTQGTFQTVSSGGRTYYCVDGIGNTNNQ